MQLCFPLAKYKFSIFTSPKIRPSWEVLNFGSSPKRTAFTERLNKSTAAFDQTGCLLEAKQLEVLHAQVLVNGFCIPYMHTLLPCH